MTAAVRVVGRVHPVQAGVRVPHRERVGQAVLPAVRLAVLQHVQGVLVHVQVAVQMVAPVPAQQAVRLPVLPAAPVVLVVPDQCVKTRCPI